MKRFIFCLLSLLCMFAVQAQVTRLDNASTPNTYVLCEHMDVGQAIQATAIITMDKIYYYTSASVMDSPCISNMLLAGTSTFGKRGVGLINGYLSINNQPQLSDGFTGNTPYRNVQRYYCYQS